MLRTPGELSAPHGPALGASRSGRQAREGGSAVNSSVPAITLTAETISATCGATSAVSRPVSSGPRMKISSISTESSA